LEALKDGDRAIRVGCLVLAISVACELTTASQARADAPTAPTPTAPTPTAPTPTAPTPTAPAATPTAARVQEAERLFELGTARMDAGDFAAACPLLEQSQAADASSGTLLNLGDCYEHLGRTASADRAFAEASEVARTTGHPDRVQVAELRRARLAPRISKLRLLPPPAPTGVTISLDDQPPTLALQPLAIAVDPGPHRIRAHAEGYADYVALVSATEASGTLDVVIPNLSAKSAASTQSRELATPNASHALDAQQIGALSCGAIGIVGVVGGAVFGFRSLSQHAESDQYCKGSVCWDQRGVDAMDRARSSGNLSTAGFLVGGAGLGVAALLWFTRPQPKGDRGTQVGLGLGSIDLRVTY
jgi:hypothetical protein